MGLLIFNFCFLGNFVEMDEIEVFIDNKVVFDEEEDLINENFE